MFGVGTVVLVPFVSPPGPLNGYAGVIMAEGCKDKIGVDKKDIEGKLASEIGTKVKLVFADADADSVDTLIGFLEKTKKEILQIQVEPHLN